MRDDVHKTPRVFSHGQFEGVQREQAVWWTLTKGAAKASCRMFSHPLGNELRLEVKTELVASEVCRSDEEILSCQEKWRSGLEAKGWRV